MFMPKYIVNCRKIEIKLSRILRFKLIIFEFNDNVTAKLRIVGFFNVSIARLLCGCGSITL